LYASYVLLSVYSHLLSLGSHPHTGRTDALSRTDDGDSDNTGHKCSITMRIGGLLPDLAERALAL